MSQTEQRSGSEILTVDPAATAQLELHLANEAWCAALTDRQRHGWSIYSPEYLALVEVARSHDRAAMEWQRRIA